MWMRVLRSLSFCRNRTDDLRTDSPALWPTEIVLHRLGHSNDWCDRPWHMARGPAQCPDLWLAWHCAYRACNTVHLGVVASGDQIRLLWISVCWIRVPSGGRMEATSRSSPGFLASVSQAHADLSMDCFNWHAVSLSFCRPVISSSCQIVPTCHPKTTRCQRKLVTTHHSSVQCPCTPSQTPSCPKKSH